MSAQLTWHVARASGMVALVLSALSVVWGLLLSTRVGSPRLRAPSLLSLHRFLGLLTVSFVAVHLVALGVDRYVPFGLTELLVPFASTWKPAEVALGVVALYLLLAVQLTSMLRRRIPPRVWLVVHQGGFLAYWLGALHAFSAGTDASNRLWQLAVLACSVVIVSLSAYRWLLGRRLRRATRTPRAATPAPGRSSKPERPPMELAPPALSTR